ncbi:MAG: glycosyltransferase family 39 protein [Thermoanaerobaculaceae bacterium]|nr:glycosyltransferase family 39 protein [Thermoanaerobaculaceae bacterium]MDI9621582.1 glycosyltransferase family 39 protein [Acidobacteriota bacterium]
MTTEQLILEGPSTQGRALGLLLLLGLLLFGAGLGLRDPWPADEPRYALVAVQMADTGQWLIPMRGAEPYPDKPPLFMWAVALGYRIVGSLRIAFLVPSLLASLATIALVYRFARRLWDDTVAWRAGLLLLLTLQFTLQARTGQIDALVAFFISLGVCSLIRALTDGRWPWWALGWTAAGLGVITKGVGFLALLVLLPALWTHRLRLRRSSWRAWMLALTGPLCFAAVIAAWVAPMLVAVQETGNPALAAYRDNILFHQTVTRYADAWHHLKPWFYYLVNVIPAFWLPISLLLPWLVGPWLRSIRLGDERVMLLLSYVLLVLAFFSLSPGKRGVYILPALPAVAALAAPYLEEVLHRRWPRRLLMTLAASFSLSLAGIAAVASFRPDLISHPFETEVALPFWPLLLAAGAAVGCVVCLRRTPLAALLATTSVVWLTVGLVVNPALNDARTPVTLLRTIEATVPADDEVLLVGWKEQFLLHAHRPLCMFPIKMPDSEQVEAAAQWQALGAKRWVVGPMRLLPASFDVGTGQDLGWRHQERWQLLPPGSARVDGSGRDTPVFNFHPLSCSAPSCLASRKSQVPGGSVESSEMTPIQEDGRVVPDAA